MSKQSKIILKVSGAAFVVTAAASVAAYITTRYLTRVALDREEPKAFKKAGNLISGSESSNAFLEALHKSAEKLAEKDNETVEIISDSVRLSATIAWIGSVGLPIAVATRFLSIFAAYLWARQLS